MHSQLLVQGSGNGTSLCNHYLTTAIIPYFFNCTHVGILPCLPLCLQSQPAKSRFVWQTHQTPTPHWLQLTWLRLCCMIPKEQSYPGVFSEQAGHPSTTGTRLTSVWMATQMGRTLALFATHGAQMKVTQVLFLLLLTLVTMEPPHCPRWRCTIRSTALSVWTGSITLLLIFSIRVASQTRAAIDSKDPRLCT
jgi:hypothetical protein